MINYESHIERVKLLQSKMDEARKTVSRITRINAEQQNELFFESALEWLSVITDNDDQAMEQLPNLKEFWGFWKKTWYNLDKVFIDHVRSCRLTEIEAINYYYMIHRTSIDNRHAHSTSVECDYHMLMKRLSYK